MVQTQTPKEITRLGQEAMLPSPGPSSLDVCDRNGYSPGLSWLEKLPLPPYLKAHRRIYRFCEPGLLFIFSMFIGMIISTALARWIALCSVAIFIYEQAL